MQDILVRAGCFVAIIILGYTLRKAGFFHADDFKVLSKIVIKITLPASIVYSFSGKQIDPSMLTIAALGLGGGLLYMGIAWLINRRAGKEQQAFEILNTSGYNIGNFTMPFVQSFLGPMGVITTSLYDTGNAFMAMLMLGVGFKLNGDRRQIGRIVKMLSVRYAVAALLALGSFYLLPFEPEIRQALMILAFSPIASAAPAFTEEMKGDVGLASAVNSLSIVISIVCIVVLLVLTL